MTETLVAPLAYTLAGIYAAVAGYCACKLRCIHRAAPEVTRQKLIHALVLLCCISRCVFFAVVPRWAGAFFYLRMTQQASDVWLYVADQAPGVVITSLFSLQLLAWADSYHTSTRNVAIYRRRVLPLVWTCNALLLACQIGVWVGYGLRPDEANTLSVLESAVDAAAFVAIAAAIAWYGHRVYHLFESVPFNFSVRRRQMVSIAALSATSALCFLLRAGVVLAAAILSDAAEEDVDANRAVNITLTVAVFTLLELVPFGLLLRSNRRVATAAAGGGRGLGSSGSGTSNLLSSKPALPPLSLRVPALPVSRSRLTAAGVAVSESGSGGSGGAALAAGPKLGLLRRARRAAYRVLAGRGSDARASERLLERLDSAASPGRRGVVSYGTVGNDKEGGSAAAALVFVDATAAPLPEAGPQAPSPLTVERAPLLRDWPAAAAEAVEDAPQAPASPQAVHVADVEAEPRL